MSLARAMDPSSSSSRPSLSADMMLTLCRCVARSAVVVSCAVSGLRGVHPGLPLLPVCRRRRSREREMLQQIDHSLVGTHFTLIDSPSLPLHSIPASLFPLSSSLPSNLPFALTRSPRLSSLDRPIEPFHSLLMQSLAATAFQGPRDSEIP